MMSKELVGWFQDSTRYATYANRAAHMVPLAKLRHARRRQLRSSVFSTGCSANGLSRKLRAKAINTKNKSPDENFESKAPANARPNFTILPWAGERHMFGICQTVRTQNKETTTSVTTSGPNAIKAGMVAKAARHNKPPQRPPRRAPVM